MRLEVLIAKIVKRHQVSCSLKSSADGLCDGMVEAAPRRMGQNNKDSQAHVSSFRLPNH
jgi:hypothetical protein